MSSFVFEIPTCLVIRNVVNRVGLEFAKHEVEHVEEMHPNIGGNPTRFLLITFPRLHIPPTPRSDIRSVDLMFTCGSASHDLLAQGHNCRVNTQLEDGVDTASSGGYDLL